MSSDPACENDGCAEIAEMVEPHACDECGAVYDEADGDGYCGLCPNCADKGVKPHA